MKYILTENQLKKIIKKVIKEDNNYSDSLFGGKPVSIPGNNSHAGQSGWPSGFAWDIMTDIGTPVYAITDGKLLTWSDYGPNIKFIHKKTNQPCTKSDIRNNKCKKLFGQSFTVDSGEGKPDVYYTHLMNSTVKKGDSIKCGQLIGYVMDFPYSDSDHVHIGVEDNNIKQFLTPDGKLMCKKGKETPDNNKRFEFKVEPSWQPPADNTRVVKYYKNLK